MKLVEFGWLDGGSTTSNRNRKIPQLRYLGNRFETTGIKDFRVRGKAVLTWDRYVRNWYGDNRRVPLKDTTGLVFRLRFKGRDGDWHHKYANINWNTDPLNGRKPHV